MMTLTPRFPAFAAAIAILIAAPSAMAQFSTPTETESPGDCELTRIVDLRSQATNLTDTDNRTAALDILREAENAEVDRRYGDCEDRLEEAEETIREFTEMEDDIDADEEFMGAQ